MLVYVVSELYFFQQYFNNSYFFSGIFVFGPVQRWNEAIRRVLFANPRYSLLVPEGLLRTGDCRRRLDGKFRHVLYVLRVLHLLLFYIESGKLLD